MFSEQVSIADIQPRQSLLNALMLDMIANTECSWYAATAAIAFWEYHYDNHTAPVYGVVQYEDERPNIVYDSGKNKRSLKIGFNVAGPDAAEEIHWAITIQF